MMEGVSMRQAFSSALADYGETNPSVVVLDADTAFGTLSGFSRERFPDRFINVGIAEQCLVDVAVGLSLAGKIPFANAFAALIATRAYEPVRTCVAYAQTNVKLAATYAGLSDYKDGATHHSIVDIAVMRALPGMVVIVAADSYEAAKWVPIVAEYKGPVYLRISRAETIPVHDEGLQLQIGKGITLRGGSDVTIAATGAMVGRTLLAAEQLAGKGIDARVLEIHTIKPLDVELIRQAAEETGAIVTAEEHSVIGGLGGAVAEALGKSDPTPLEMVGILDEFTKTGLDVESLMDACGLAVADVVAAASRAVARK